MNPHPRRPVAMVAASAIALSFVAAELNAQTVIAHRGASAYLPEHTFAAWDRAVELGADYIEQDLQMTADGVLVVLHDDTLDRVARGPAEDCTGPVSGKTLAQLQRCEVSSWKIEALRAAGESSRAAELAALPPQRIPTLQEVFERYGSDGSVRYYIEIKSPEDAPGMEVELLR
ncbi:MAG TPA: glycerophosphodiester phosphodiesterase family protein, partial [Longimicrobiales bacterium]|nr:glycerophosphodiester phosphodiesterase family protein [Longimicrobiales bacterium]